MGSTAGAARCVVFAVNALLMVRARCGKRSGAPRVTAQILGCVILGFSAVIVRQKGTQHITPILALILGGVIVGLAMMAVCGTLTKARTCLSFYLWALLPLTAIQLVVGILALVRSDQIATVASEKSAEYGVEGGRVEDWLLRNVKAAGIILLVVTGIQLVNAALVLYISGAITRERARHDTVTLAFPDGGAGRRRGRARPPAVDAIRDKYGFGAGSTGGGEVAV